MSSRTTRKRIPLTITLDPKEFCFVESCGETGATASINPGFPARLDFLSPLLRE